MGSSIAYSNVFVIDSYENSCAMNAGFKIVDELSMDDLTFICFDDEYSTKKLLKSINRQNKVAKFIFLKESWQKIYDGNGHKKFIMELLSFIKHSNTKAIFLYRLDKVLTGLREEESKLLIKMLFDELKSGTKKIILNYDSTTIYGRVLREYIGDDIKIEYRLKSVDDCSFNTIDRKVEAKDSLKEEFEVLLLSSDEELLYAHKKLFSKKDGFVFFQERSEDFTHKYKEVDLVIINDDESRLNFALIKEIKNMKKDIKIIYLNRKKPLRLEDKLSLKENNILYIDGIKSFEEYVDKLESLIGRDFYFKRVKEFFDKDTLDSRYDLKETIKRLEESGILFSLLEISEKKLKKSRQKQIKDLIRDHDFVFKNSASGEIFLVLVNLLGKNAKKILSKRLSIKKKMIKLYKLPVT